MQKFLEQKLSFLSQGTKNVVIFVVDIVLNIVVILGLVFVIRTYIVSPFKVWGPSMCDTLNFLDDKCNRNEGEYIIVNKAVYQNFFGNQVGLPDRGQIVVFHPPQSNEEFFIKRVIGLPGETVKLQDGYVYVYNTKYPQGIKLEEPYLNATNQGNTLPTPGETDTFVVPADRYFVLGDNRTQSSDSRSCFKETLINKYCSREGVTAFITLKEIEGKAWVVLWPLNKIRTLPDHQYQL